MHTPLQDKLLADDRSQQYSTQDFEDEHAVLVSILVTIYVKYSCWQATSHITIGSLGHVGCQGVPKG